ncbi:hypothetical protein L1987_60970 [Smallanthus sonchifolius]|uniref:Uncharacterized protein n=1 Tax=Smallanthus sonchifolius TaxID=185202 RepID=A0ACB9D9J2_9ASTR|nr:hypothetical protein L1987_60970 [Smallanthus sonchifolius]
MTNDQPRDLNLKIGMALAASLQEKIPSVLLHLASELGTLIQLDICFVHLDPTRRNAQVPSDGARVDKNDGVEKNISDDVRASTRGEGSRSVRSLAALLLSSTAAQSSGAYPTFERKGCDSTLAQEYGFEYELVTYKWPSWLHKQKEKQRIIWAYKTLFLDVIFPLSLEKVIFVNVDQIVRGELYDMNLKGRPLAYTPFCDNNRDMGGFRFWKQFRETAVGDSLRVFYETLSKDPNSLSNLDQASANLPTFFCVPLPEYSFSPSRFEMEPFVYRVVVLFFPMALVRTLTKMEPFVQPLIQVARWGGDLPDRGILTLSLAPRDSCNSWKHIYTTKNRADKWVKVALLDELLLKQLAHLAGNVVKMQNACIRRTLNKGNDVIYELINKYGISNVGHATKYYQIPVSPRIRTVL